MVNALDYVRGGPRFVCVCVCEREREPFLTVKRKLMAPLGVPQFRIVASSLRVRGRSPSSFFLGSRVSCVV